MVCFKTTCGSSKFMFSFESLSARKEIKIHQLNYASNLRPKTTELAHRNTWGNLFWLVYSARFALTAECLIPVVYHFVTFEAKYVHCPGSDDWYDGMCHYNCSLKKLMCSSLLKKHCTLYFCGVLLPHPTQLNTKLI